MANFFGRRRKITSHSNNKALLSAIELSPTQFVRSSPSPPPPPGQLDSNDLEGSPSKRTRSHTKNNPVYKKKKLSGEAESTPAHTPQPESPQAESPPPSPSPSPSPTRANAKKLNKFFIESKSKPSWSPTKTPMSPPPSVYSNNTNIHSSKVMALTEKLQNLSSSPQSQSQSQSQPQSPQAKVSNGWDLLDDIEDDDDHLRKSRTTLVKKVLLRSPRKPKQQYQKNGDESHRAVIQFFESSYFKESDPNKNGGEEEEEDQILKSPMQQGENTETSRLIRHRKTYGTQRSYLAERSTEDESHEDEDHHHHHQHQKSEDPDHDEDQDQDHLKSITNLRAQGESAKFLDDFNFIIEGIESKPSLFSLLELAVKLFDDDFLRFVKSRGIPPLQNIVDGQDSALAYVLGFILCKVSDHSHTATELDTNMITVVETLINSPSKVPIDKKKLSKSVKILFKEFVDKLGEQYTPQFVAITLLFQNGLFLNNELVSLVASTLWELNLGIDIDLKLYNMVLILLESYLSKQDNVPEEFTTVHKFITKTNTKDQQTDLLQLKLLIVLAVKKFDNVYQPTLITKALNSTVSTTNTELQLLNIGLVISLIENPICLQTVLKPANVKKLHTLYGKVSDESIPYFSLLLGTLYADSPLQVRKHFHGSELDRIILELQKFEKFDNKLMGLQVQQILAQLNR